METRDDSRGGEVKKKLKKKICGKKKLKKKSHFAERDFMNHSENRTEHNGGFS